ncbi:unnamed protein product, partial [Lymnaea stagnalis]
MWVFCGVGLPANVLIIATISRFQAGGPASFLLCFLTVVDSAALVAKLMETNIVAYHGQLGGIGCRIIDVPFRTLSAIRNWTVVVICAERCVAVCKPFKRNVWISKQRCKIIVSLISILLTLFVVSI